MKRAVVISNGNLSDFSRLKSIIRKDDYIICADGGADYLLSLNIEPNAVIGDFDSISEKSKDKLSRLHIHFIKFPTEKDKTDFELAIDYILEKKFREILIFGILGDRIDQMFANILFLSKIRQNNNTLKITIIEGTKDIYIVEKNIKFKGKIGDGVSVIPVNDGLKGVETEGLEYPLKGNLLKFGTTKGISNVMIKPIVEISIKEGIALTVHNRR